MRCALPTVRQGLWWVNWARQWCRAKRYLRIWGNNMYYVVTGAAGFIGSNLVKALNERGETNIIAVDNLKSNADKFRNLTDCEIADYIDKEDFIGLLQDGSFDGILNAVFHEGACSDTMETDGHYMMENNYRYSLEIL